jgi:predicted phosphohydrolase
MEDFSYLVAGDKVIVESGFGYKSQEITTVDRITKTQIIIGNSKYRRNNGYIVGGTTWSRRYLTRYTEEAAAKVHLRIMRDQLSAYNWQKAPEDLVTMTYAAMKNRQSPSKGSDNAS